MIPARRLTPEGVRRAKEHLAALRADPAIPPETPSEILFDAPFSSPLENAPIVSRQSLHTRRDAAYLMTEIVSDMAEQPFDDMPFWSWMGMYFLADILNVGLRRSQMSQEDETFVVEGLSAAPIRSSYRHYLWSAWRLWDRFGEDVKYLLDRDLTEMGVIFRLSTNSRRIFNARAIVPLIMQLYTDDG